MTRLTISGLVLAGLCGVVSITYAQEWDYSADGSMISRESAMFGAMIAADESDEFERLPLDGAVQLTQTGVPSEQTSLDASAGLSPSEFVTLEQFESLRDQIAALQADVENPSVAPELPKPKQPEKKFPDVRLTGFVHLDSLYFDQDADSRETLGDIEDGLGFRRARLAATGNISPRASYMMEFDFAQAQARFVDVWGQINKTPMGNLRIGRYRQPFGMTELSSARVLPTLERPTIFALSPFRQTGMMLFDTALDEQMTWAVSGFRALTDNFGNVYSDSGYGTAARVTTLLVDSPEEHVVHAGFGHSYVNPGLGSAFVVTQDEAFVGQGLLAINGLSPTPITNVPAFINTGFFPVDDYNSFNVEAAASVGQALIQSEYRWSDYNLPNGENVVAHGGYAHIRYVWTGETIPYVRSEGAFGRITPNRPLNIRCGDWGALESVAQVSLLDATNLFGQPGVGPRPARLATTSLALNWYWFTNAKSQFEWINGSLDNPGSGVGAGESETNTYAARLQFDF